MKSVTGQASVNFSAEWQNETIYADQTDPTLRAAGTLQGAYSWSGAVSSQGRRAYAQAPIMPAFLLEEPYDQEGPGPDGNNVNPSATQPVRRFQWWGWLATIGGYISGNGYVWPFNPGWQSHLNTQGAQDMARLNTFMKSIAWYNLVPSGLGGMTTLITAGGGSCDSSVNFSNCVAAAATPDGSLLVAYIPPAHNGSITVNMTAMRGAARARWFDPTSGAYANAGTGLPNTGTRSFTPPGANSAGNNDWVLVLQVGATRFDFNGDGKSDILWRDTSIGQNGIWLMNGSTLNSSSYITSVSAATPGWTIAGVGDFNGDGKSDILWRDTSTGQNGIWLMDGFTVTSSSYITSVSVATPGWIIAGVGDFNGDGKSDILWRNTSTGQNRIWLMNGFTLTSETYISSVSAVAPGWNVVNTH
jgi:hypothetical protein